MFDIRPRKLIRLAGSVLCDGRQMALGRKRKRGYKGWLTAQIYYMWLWRGGYRLRDILYVLGPLVYKTGPYKCLHPLPLVCHPFVKTIYWIALVKFWILRGDFSVNVRILVINKCVVLLFCFSQEFNIDNFVML